MRAGYNYKYMREERMVNMLSSWVYLIYRGLTSWWAHVGDGAWIPVAQYGIRFCSLGIIIRDHGHIIEREKEKEKMAANKRE